MLKLGPKHKCLFMMTHVTGWLNKRYISCSINTLHFWLNLSSSIWVTVEEIPFGGELRYSKRPNLASKTMQSFGRKKRRETGRPNP